MKGELTTTTDAPDPKTQDARSQTPTIQVGVDSFAARFEDHDANAVTFTVSQQSIHVTLGIFPPRGVDFLKTITSTASGVEFFKKGISKSVECKQQSLTVFSKSLPAEFQGVLKQFTETELANFVATNFLGVPAQDNTNRFQDLFLLKSIKNETIMYRREKIVFNFSKALNKVELSLYDKTIVFPDYVCESIDFILTHPTFSIQEITGCLNDEAKLVLVRKLVKEGLLSFSRP